MQYSLFTEGLVLCSTSWNSQDRLNYWAAKNKNKQIKQLLSWAMYGYCKCSGFFFLLREFA